MKIYGLKNITPIVYPYVPDVWLGPGTTFPIYSEQWFDSIPARLIAGGMTPEQALAYCESNVPILLNKNVVARAGTFVPTCPATGSRIAPTPNLDNGFWYVLPFNYLPDARTYVREDIFFVTEVGRKNSQAGGPGGNGVCFMWPAAAPYEITPGECPVNGSWDYFAFESSSADQGNIPGLPFRYYWLPEVEALLQITNIANWFNGVVDNEPPPSPPSKFLIPPENLTPVQSNIVTPELSKMIRVSNHTYQFEKNFGRIK